MEKHNFSKRSAVNIVGGIFDTQLSLPHIKIKEYLPNQILIKADSKDYMLIRIADFNKYTVENQIFILKKGKTHGNGLRAFINEINELRKLKFKNMTVHAIFGLPEFNGAYTWARFGFEIIGLDREDFIDFLKYKHKRSEESLIDLMNTPNGQKFWKKYAFDFRGYFDLTKSSENLKALKRYVTEKKKPYLIS